MSTDTQIQIISRKELKELMDGQQDFELIEVLPTESYEEMHIEGAINVPGDSLRQLMPERVPNKDKTVVVYCSSPACTASDRAAEVLADMGYTDVRDYRGGKEHWKEGGLPVSSGAHAGQPA